EAERTRRSRRRQGQICGNRGVDGILNRPAGETDGRTGFEVRAVFPRPYGVIKRQGSGAAPRCVRGRSTRIEREMRCAGDRYGIIEREGDRNERAGFVSAVDRG